MTRKVIATLTQNQRAVLDQAANEVGEAQREFIKAQRTLEQLLYMACPTDGCSYDPKTGEVFIVSKEEDLKVEVVE